MKIHIRLMAFAVGALFFSSAYFSCAFASSTINIFFVNKTNFDYTLHASAANFCIDTYDENPFTVPAGHERTFYATIHPNCSTAQITLDYSQTIRPDSDQHTRMINGTITYDQFTQKGNWMAKLNIRLTPPAPSPMPVVFRTGCGEKFLFCSTAPVPMPTSNLFSRFTVIPDQSFLNWGFAALVR